MIFTDFVGFPGMIVGRGSGVAHAPAIMSKHSKCLVLEDGQMMRTPQMSQQEVEVVAQTLVQSHSTIVMRAWDRPAQAVVCGAHLDVTVIVTTTLGVPVTPIETGTGTGTVAIAILVVTAVVRVAVNVVRLPIPTSVAFVIVQDIGLKIAQSVLCVTLRDPLQLPHQVAPATVIR